MKSRDKSGKNAHLDHIEDLPLLGGIDGTRNAIRFLQSLRDMLAGHTPKRGATITTKFDGAPAIITGINPENGKFFVATKGAFAANPKLNYSDEDIDRNHPNPGLNGKLKICLRHLPELGIKGILQGDMMYTSEDLKSELIDGQRYVTFRPNTILYAIPEDSPLATIIQRSKMGIVFHTEYHGDTIQSMKASFPADIRGLHHSNNVWYRDATFTDASGVATFTQSETEAITTILSEAGSLFRQLAPAVLNRIAATDTIRIDILAFNNSKVKAGHIISNTAHHTADLINSIDSKYNSWIQEAKRPETRKNRELIKKEVMSFLRGSRNQLKLIFDMQNLLLQAKEMIIAKLNQVRDIGTFIPTEDGFRVTNPEGFVCIDHMSGNAVKLVSRLEFSHANFTVKKNWMN